MKMKKREIVLRTGWGSIKKKVEVQFISHGRRASHNRDGSFTYCRARGNDGTIYETKSRGGGWRVAKNQNTK